MFQKHKQKINFVTASWRINIISCVNESPTDYVAKWKFCSARRQNEKKFKKMNDMQSKNRSRPMAARLIINNVQSKNRARPMAARLKRGFSPLTRTLWSLKAGFH